MPEVRFEISGVLETLAPLHVGSGERGSFTRTDGETATMAEVIRDFEGKPCLPGSTLKGLLRRVAEGLADAAAVTALFGSPRIAPRSEEEPGSGGWLLVRAALLLAPGPGAEKLPQGNGETGIFIDARTRIDRATGTADDAKLFHVEQVAPGSRFGLRLILLRPDPGRLDLLRRVLGALTDPAGLMVGHGQSDGYGRLWLRPETVEGLDGLAPPPARTKPIVLRLHCSGPYLTLDSSKRQRQKNRDEDDEPEKLQPLLDGKGKPVLRPTQLLGVLRARAAWLESLESIETGADPKTVDDRDRIYRAGETTLTPVERLFGVNGWRGLLAVERIETRAPGQEFDITSVALDSFSQAPLDGALFTTTVFVGCNYKVSLRLEESARCTEADRALCERLIADAVEEGLMLGHGTNKGFGWFTVTREDRQ